MVPRLNITYVPGMPIRIRTGHHCYLIEYREGHACPLVLGLGAGIVIYARVSDVIADPDSEDLSSFNNMFPKQRQKSDLKGLLGENH